MLNRATTRDIEALVQSIVQSRLLSFFAIQLEVSRYNRLMNLRGAKPCGYTQVSNVRKINVRPPLGSFKKKQSKM